MTRTVAIGVWGFVLIVLFIVLAPSRGKSEPGWSPEFRERMNASCLVTWAGQPKVEEVCPCFVKGVEEAGVTEQEALDFFYSPEPAATDAKVHKAAEGVIAACVEKHLGVIKVI